MHLSADHHSVLLNLARIAIRRKLTNQLDAPLLADDPALHQPAGCFVSLHELDTHRLRGCIGRLESNGPLVEVVCAMAESVLEDPRFTNDPVRAEELPKLEIELSIISPLQPAADPLDFDLLIDGIVLTSLGRKGCFLPQAARETGWTREQLLGRLCSEKLGLSADAWRKTEARLERFQTLVVGPEAFGE